MQQESIEAVPEFPSLNSGLTLLEVDEQTTGALHSLVLNHVLLDDAATFWIDSRGYATTQSLAQLAPSQRLLDQIMVARAFTAFQHYSLVEDLNQTMLNGASLLVLPAIDWFYANDDLRHGEGREMLTDAVTQIQELTTDIDLPVLLTRTSATGLGTCLTEYVDSQLNCTITQFGPRFTGSDFETLVFECPGGVQTTLAFWRRVLQARHSSIRESQPEVVAYGSH